MIGRGKTPITQTDADCFGRAQRSSALPAFFRAPVIRKTRKSESKTVLSLIRPDCHRDARIM
jgi:hypothetical protein